MPINTTDWQAYLLNLINTSHPFAKIMIEHINHQLDKLNYDIKTKQPVQSTVKAQWGKHTGKIIHGIFIEELDKQIQLLKPKQQSQLKSLLYKPNQMVFKNSLHVDANRFVATLIFNRHQPQQLDIKKYLKFYQNPTPNLQQPLPRRDCLYLYLKFVETNFIYVLTQAVQGGGVHVS